MESRRSAGPVLARSSSLEAKFGFKSSNFASASSSSFPSMASSANRFRLAVDRSKKKTCMCSPTTHPGSFRCSSHKRTGSGGGGGAASSRLNARRSAMTNSLVRIGTVEGEMVRRALAALIRPSSHHQRRRSGFQPRPTRLSVMSTAGEVA
uniref:Serine-rich protein-like protein n=1 Tax=Kalanchoe fedtschenkoi TaxID=63787 RepID=A0A7N0TAT4_KALFE